MVKGGAREFVVVKTNNKILSIGSCLLYLSYEWWKNASKLVHER